MNIRNESGNILILKTKDIRRMIHVLEIVFRKLLNSEEVYIQQEGNGVGKIAKEGFVTIHLNVINRNGDTIKQIDIGAELSIDPIPNYEKIPTSYHGLEWIACMEVAFDNKELFPIPEAIEEIFNRDGFDKRKEDPETLVHMEWYCVNIPLYTHYLMERVAKKIN